MNWFKIITARDSMEFNDFNERLQEWGCTLEPKKNGGIMARSPLSGSFLYHKPHGRDDFIHVDILTKAAKHLGFNKQDFLANNKATFLRLVEQKRKEEEAIAKAKLIAPTQNNKSKKNKKKLAVPPKNEIFDTPKKHLDPLWLQPSTENKIKAPLYLLQPNDWAREELIKWLKENNIPLDHSDYQPYLNRRTGAAYNLTKEAKTYGCKGWIAVRLEGSVKSKIKKWGKENIPDEILTGDGREEDTHITVVYGLCADQRETVKSIVKDFGSIKATLGKVGFFKNPEFDVVIIKIESEGLHKLNEKIVKVLNVESTHSSYKPHCTIAYVTKGEAAKYAGDTVFKGEELVFDKIVFINDNKEETSIKL